MTPDLESQIIEKINRILDFDLGKLYPRNPNVQNWNNLSLIEVERSVQIFLDILKEAKSNISTLNSALPQDVRTFNDQLSGFISLYIDSGLPTLSYQQITNQHHSTLSQLVSIVYFLKSNGLFVDLNVSKGLQTILSNKISSFTNAERLAETLGKEYSDIVSAIEGAQKWLSIRRDVNGRTIEQQAEAFHDMAREHKFVHGWVGSINGPEKFWDKIKELIFNYDLSGSWVWLILTFLFASLTGWVTYEFIVKAANFQDIKVGTALLRIASLAVPSYLTIFATSQFLYHKRLYNNYMFKYSSMNTMNNLMATHVEQSNQILDKGMDILFSEPKTRETSTKYDSHLFTELVKMLQDQINK